MPAKDISDKELDAMIDASIKQPKEEEGVSKAMKPKAAGGKGKAAAKPSGGALEQKRAAEEPGKPVAGKAEGIKAPAEKSGRPASAKDAKKTKEAAALKPVEGYDPWNVLSYPHLTEKSMNLVEKDNVLVFIVSMDATKVRVKEAVEKGFGARVESVRVEITRKNQKKAYVKLAEGGLASDIATRLGMI